MAGAIGVSPGLDAIDAAIYRLDDFPGGPPVSWSTSSGSNSPAQRPSRPLRGYALEKKQLMDDDLIYLRLRVSSDRRPLEFTGVAVEYRQGGKRYRQVVPTTFKVESAG